MDHVCSEADQSADDFDFALNIHRYSLVSSVESPAKTETCLEKLLLHLSILRDSLTPPEMILKYTSFFFVIRQLTRVVAVNQVFTHIYT